MSNEVTRKSPIYLELINTTQIMKMYYGLWWVKANIIYKNFLWNLKE